MRREPGAHFPREPELAVVVIADEQRIEVGIVRLEPTHDEFLPGAELHLHPSAVTLPRFVPGVTSLRDDTFEMQTSHGRLDIRH